MSTELERKMGIKVARALELSMQGRGLEVGITASDYKCDADSGQKLEDAMRIYEKNKKR